MLITRYCNLIGIANIPAAHIKTCPNTPDVCFPLPSFRCVQYTCTCSIRLARETIVDPLAHSMASLLTSQPGLALGVLVLIKTEKPQLSLSIHCPLPPSLPPPLHCHPTVHAPNSPLPSPSPSLTPRSVWQREELIVPP